MHSTPIRAYERVGFRRVYSEEERRPWSATPPGAPVLTLGTDDIHAAYEWLKERGVR